MAKTSFDFSSHRYTDSELNVKATVIEESLTDNPNFPTLTTEVPLIKSLNDQLAAAIIKAKDGGHKDVFNKNSVRKALETQLKLSGLLVQNVSKGDESMILSSGYEVNKTPEPIGPLPKPVNLQAKPGDNHGSLKVSWNPVPGAYLYEVEYTESPVTSSSIRTRFSCSKHNAIIDNLTPGKMYSIFVAGAGSDPRRVWSNELTSYVM